MFYQNYLTPARANQKSLSKGVRLQKQTAKHRGPRPPYRPTYLPCLVDLRRRILPLLLPGFQCFP